ncbi:hypothetical protein LEP1GSC103_1756 [Leptospira borgpetersenii serovar Javanica str. UI 09931]|uniref:Uncharacterized protein n=5 Tax=Leptospira borgpetersenii TaxID=174 RepID=M3GDV4_LEPBO|nr:hypothetical protein LBBP_01423 [Leptospira borgpetersenii serovar Ballum]EKP11983.1 hypothetical protein LEP1GSC128_0113 [Leptospira borgpetersenii str. 200801926]EKQ90819.1 hypothetical protein LEP1GSC101_1342 [Leptospira borgpetersenii str. UI 09149]EKR00573.1 hypothetical protein LEP1GSC121_1339 [Leptospira borgpetersenii serovar Castellonis str. 200801910]EMF99121.1 hypothetical protein LEP1GSC123_3358 [Leptospira borgpetersenii str. 200701203]EMK09532.1 hypothetical protein LEP1GSC066
MLNSLRENEISNREKVWILSLNESENELQVHNDRLFG